VRDGRWSGEEGAGEGGGRGWVGVVGGEQVGGTPVSQGGFRVQSNSSLSDDQIGHFSKHISVQYRLAVGPRDLEGSSRLFIVIAILKIFHHTYFLFSILTIIGVPDSYQRFRLDNV
jgi:hypothetical protein